MPSARTSRREALRIGAFAAMLPWRSAADPKPKTPLPTAHAHNDYAHPAPFHGSFGLGYRSIEVDVFPVDGRLLVAHDAKDLRPERSLEALYLAPILARCRAAHAERGPCPYGHPLTLLVDIKRHGDLSTTLLEAELEPLLPWLRRVEGGRIVDGPIEIVVSGARSLEKLAGRDDRLVFVDGRVKDLASPPPATLMPQISASFRSVAGSYGIRGLDDAAKSRIADVAEQARNHGRRLRFWGHMEAPWIWSTLVANRVDLIGSDVPWALARWLRANDPRCRPTPNSRTED